MSAYIPCAHPTCDAMAATVRSDVERKQVWVCRPHVQWLEEEIDERRERHNARQRGRKDLRQAQGTLFVDSAIAGIERVKEPGVVKSRHDRDRWREKYQKQDEPPAD